MMKLLPGYCLRNILDSWLVVGTGGGTCRPDCIMSVNETGAALWPLLEDGTDREAMVRLLTGEFQVADADAAQDVDHFLAQLQEHGLVTGC